MRHPWPEYGYILKNKSAAPPASEEKRDKARGLLSEFDHARSRRRISDLIGQVTDIIGTGSRTYAIIIVDAFLLQYNAITFDEFKIRLQNVLDLTDRRYEPSDGSRFEDAAHLGHRDNPYDPNITRWYNNGYRPKLWEDKT